MLQGKYYLLYYSLERKRERETAGTRVLEGVVPRSTTTVTPRERERD